jgi:hypothetical protein
MAGHATCAPASTRREPAKTPRLPSSVHVRGVERMRRITPPPAPSRRETRGGVAPPTATILDPTGRVLGLHCGLAVGRQPTKFRLDIPKKYGGMIDPEEFL